MTLDAFLTLFVARLETIPTLVGKVAVGVPAQMENITSAPYVWVTDLAESGSGSPVVGPVRQKKEVLIEITVGARTRADLHTIRAAIETALLNFQADAGYDPMTFRAGRMDFGDAGWHLWRDQYRTAYYRIT